MKSGAPASASSAARCCDNAGCVMCRALATKRILMVVTSHDAIFPDHPTGIWLSEFSQPYALFLPGGHGAMYDLPGSEELARALRSFYEAGRVVAAVCHGPAWFVGTTLSDGSPLVRGKRVTGFTNEEEKATGLDPYMPFLLEDRTKELGAEFVAAPNWADHIERDGRLITGQNPQSSVSAAKAVIQALEESAAAGTR